MTAIQVRDLHKSYGAVHAVQGLSFDVAEGEIFAAGRPKRRSAVGRRRLR